MNDEFKNEIISDLKLSGMESELRARREITSRGWSLSGAAGYYDRDERKFREIDIVATNLMYRAQNGSPTVRAEFSVVAEVKKCKHPWVVFKHYPHSAIIGCAWDNLIRHNNLAEHPMVYTAALKKLSLFRENGWIGTGIHESFKKPADKSRWHGAFMAAVKAADEYKDKFQDLSPPAQEAYLPELPTEFYFVQPLVILDGELLSAELSPSNEIKVECIEAAAFQFEFRTDEYINGPYRVDVVTIGGLNGYLELIEKRQYGILNALISGVDVSIESSSND